MSKFLLFSVCLSIVALLIMSIMLASFDPLASLIMLALSCVFTLVVYEEENKNKRIDLELEQSTLCKMWNK
jgi:hypothetical protein